MLKTSQLSSVFGRECQPPGTRAIAALTAPMRRARTSSCAWRSPRRPSPCVYRKDMPPRAIGCPSGCPRVGAPGMRRGSACGAFLSRSQCPSSLASGSVKGRSAGRPIAPMKRAMSDGDPCGEWVVMYSASNSRPLMHSGGCAAMSRNAALARSGAHTPGSKYAPGADGVLAGFE